MILGIGIDIVEIERIGGSLQRHAEPFVNRILHDNERRIFQAHKQQVKYLAKRFAAKEAFAKALGLGIAEGVSWQEIEVVNNPLGKPEIKLHGKTRQITDKLGAEKIFLSISDERHYAVAQVVIEGQATPSV